MHTMERTIGLPVLRGLPVPLTRWLVGPATARLMGVDQRVPWTTRVLFRVGQVLVGLIDSVVRLFMPGFSLSRLFTRVVGYHFLTRFLMNQVRPLALPEHVLNPMADTIAAWGHDAQAPDWVNALEDRFTTSGPWRPRAERGV
jgi:hypothetical protein